jgi:hypothetical protein
VPRLVANRLNVVPAARAAVADHNTYRRLSNVADNSDVVSVHGTHLCFVIVPVNMLFYRQVAHVRSAVCPRTFPVTHHFPKCAVWYPFLAKYCAAVVSALLMKS